MCLPSDFVQSPGRRRKFLSKPCNERPPNRTYLAERRERPLDNMEQIYQAHAQTVYKYLLSQCRDADLAEELTQETFYQAVRSIDRFKGDCKVSVWLCQIAKHLWYQHLRKHRTEEPLPEDGLPAPSAEEDTLARQGHLDLLRRIHSLSPNTREVVYLRAFGGLSFREIGDVLGRTETWARVTFYRGKEALRKGDENHEEHS